jgi:hypothetical protein
MALCIVPLRLWACEIALVLAVDVSGSVDAKEYDLQMRGLALALRDGAVSEALVSSRAQVALVQWTGSSRQQVALPWREIRSFADTEALAVAVTEAPRAWRHFSTAIGAARLGEIVRSGPAMCASRDRPVRRRVFQRRAKPRIHQARACGSGHHSERAGHRRGGRRSDRIFL